MRNIYYKIWIDAIVQERGKKGDQGSWKAFTIIPISILQGINLLTLILVIRILTNNSIPVVLSMGLFRERAINTFFAGILTFFMPFVILNYLLIFYNERYQHLMIKYHDSQGKLYRNYFFWSVGVIIIPLFLKFIF